MTIYIFLLKNRCMYIYCMNNATRFVFNCRYYYTKILNQIIMKKITGFLTLLMMTFAFVAFANNGEEGKVNTEKSVITWKGYKVTGQHEGTLEIKNGKLNFDKGNLTGGSFDIDMTSIATTDLSGGTAEKLNGHLKSPDFFGVEKFPTATVSYTHLTLPTTPYV